VDKMECAGFLRMMMLIRALFHSVVQ